MARQAVNTRSMCIVSLFTSDTEVKRRRSEFALGSLKGNMAQHRVWVAAALLAACAHHVSAFSAPLPVGLRRLPKLPRPAVRSARVLATAPRMEAVDAVCTSSVCSTFMCHVCCGRGSHTIACHMSVCPC